MKVRVGPNGLHLFDRNTGINVLLDEIPTAEQSWSRAPVTVSIALTNACDLRCSYCYAPKQNATLDADRVVDWLMELDANGCLAVGFGGGEPTLSPILSDLCKRIALSTSMAVSFTTHSHRIDDRLASELAGSVHFIRVSVDGVGHTYERLRGRPFASLLSRLHVVRALAPFGLNTVVNAETVDQLEDIARLAQDVGATDLLLLPERPTARTSGIAKAHHHKLRRWVQSYRGPIGLSVSEFGADGLPWCDPLSGEVGLRRFAHIDAFGALKRSSFAAVGVSLEGRRIMDGIDQLSREQEARS